MIASPVHWVCTVGALVRWRLNKSDVTWCYSRHQRPPSRPPWGHRHPQSWRSRRSRALPTKLPAALSTLVMSWCQLTVLELPKNPFIYIFEKLFLVSNICQISLYKILKIFWNSKTLETFSWPLSRSRRSQFHWADVGQMLGTHPPPENNVEMIFFNSIFCSTFARSTLWPS